MQPHGGCFLWRYDILFPYVFGNSLTFLSYMAIPIMFVFLLRKEGNNLPIPRVFGIYAAFILFCGVGHLIMIFNVWNINYKLEAYWSIATGFVSVIAASASYTVIRTLFRMRADGKFD